MDEGDRNTRQESTVTPVDTTASVKPVRMYPGFGREVASVALKGTVFFIVFLFIAGSIGAVYQDSASISDGTCNIAVFPLTGVIAPYDVISFDELIITPDSVRTFLENAENDPYVSGVLFEVNSPGGTPVASEQIAELIALTPLPTVGSIGDIGTSGAYLAVSATDHLIASAMSDVGSIGVTMSYLDQTEQNKIEGLEFVQLSAGEFKDAGNPNKELTEQERAIFERDLEIIYDEFVRRVSEYRGLTIPVVEVLADGSSMTGKRAFDVGLIDAIGGRQEAQRYFAETLNLAPEAISFCEYRHQLIDTIF